MTSYASSAATSVQNAASSAYNQAPDLGVTSTLQAGYDKLPALTSGANGDASANGQDRRAASSSGNDDDEQGDQSEDVSENADPEATTGAQRLQTQHEQRLNKSKESGPSSDSRIGKSQAEIGIEDNIPTAAGKGTTLPGDATVQEAAGKGAKRNDAKVPQDFEQVDCPSAEISGKAPTDYTPQQQGAATSEGGEGAAAAAGGDEQQEEEGKRSLGKKVKDQIKGEVKVLKGAIKSDQELKAQGQAIKKGE